MNKTDILTNLRKLKDKLGIYKWSIVTKEDYEYLNINKYRVPEVIEILINTVIFFSDKLEEQREEKTAVFREYEALKLECQRLYEENIMLKKTVEKMDKYTVAKAAVSSGKKIAYKDEIDNNIIINLLRAGKTKTEIARRLGITRQTLYNRIKEIEAAGIRI